jgi:hypothetical protein
LNDTALHDAMPKTSPSWRATEREWPKLGLTGHFWRDC